AARTLRPALAPSFGGDTGRAGATRARLRRSRRGARPRFSRYVRARRPAFSLRGVRGVGRRLPRAPRRTSGRTVDPARHDSSPRRAHPSARARSVSAGHHHWRGTGVVEVDLLTSVPLPSTPPPQHSTDPPGTSAHAPEAPIETAVAGAKPETWTGTEESVV